MWILSLRRGLHGPIRALPQAGLLAILGLAGVLALGAASTSVRAERLQLSGSADPERFECPAIPVVSRPVRPTSTDAPPDPLTAEELNDLLQQQGEGASDLSFDQGPPVFQQKRTLRLALWGDSHAAARFFSDGLAEGLGHGPQDWQPSFLPPALGMPGVRLPWRKSCIGSGWKRSFAHRAAADAAPFGRGLLRASADEPDSYVWLDFRAALSPDGLRALDVVFSRPDGSGPASTVLAVSVNDSAEERVVIDRDRDRVLQLVSETALMTVKLRLISGQLALDGFLPQYRREAGLVLDTFGIPGATARGWSNLDPSSWTGSPERGDYDVVLMAYGTNEGADPDYQAQRYESGLRLAVSKLRAVYPSANCVLIGPTDRGVIRRKAGARKPRIDRAEAARLLHYARVHRSITEVQQRVGHEMGCSSWDWQAAMGGPGGAYRWLAQAPRLMAPDLIHLTAEGYRLSGRKLAARLLGAAERAARR